MSYRVRVLCRPPLAAGFRLAALTPMEAQDPEEGGRRLAALLDEQDLGVVLVEDALYAALPAAAQRRGGGGPGAPAGAVEAPRRPAREPLPLVVPFPGPAWGPPHEGAEAYIAELLRRAIGYRVRLG
jgi:vacuolar-type H+-ATPase subunit F/Vma7